MREREADMKVLGIESTAHTASVGFVSDGEIVDFRSHSYRPLKGGINPREAADHHRLYFPVILDELLNEWDLRLKDFDKIAVSTGPGLGPSLKVGVSLARYISLRVGKPLVSVNHGVGHLEISRKLSGFRNPLFLYVSGGNTQLVSIGNRRYSVLGETLDIGVGNFLDKIARDMGYPFPGAPNIESLARQGEKVLSCPYVVKGMDVSFSGLYTFLKNVIGRESPEDIAFNAQEYAFTALAEILERGMAHFGITQFSITGGVARNRRLREILSGMAEMRGYEYYFPDERYLSDNGAMIALAGYMSSDIRRTINIDMNDRVDSRRVEWIGKNTLKPKAMVGGESLVSPSRLYGMDCIIKKRTGVDYRNRMIDRRISTARLKREVKMLAALKNAGINAPTVLFVDLDDMEFVMDKIDSRNLSTLLNDKNFGNYLREAGKNIAKLHDRGMSHGDLNVGNILIGDGLFIIDPSMGELNAEDEDMGVDLHLMKKSLETLGKKRYYESFLEGYRKYKRSSLIIRKVKEIEGRRRYT